MTSLEKITCAIIIFVIHFELSRAITCYQCNSEYDPRCGDPFDDYSIGQVNCSRKEPLEHLRGMEAVLCRKTVQKIFGKVRIVRECGYVQNANDDHECFRRTGTFEVESVFCSCTGDLCNATPATTHQTAFGQTFYIMLATLPLLVTSIYEKLGCARRLSQ